MNGFEIVPSVEQVSGSYRGVLLDAYGVFWGGNEQGLLPGSKEAMEHLVSSGKIVGILSNTTQLAFKEINKLQAHGLIQGKHFHFLITSGEVARMVFLNKKLPFETPRNTFWVLGGVHPKFHTHAPIFHDSIYHETANIDDADFIYVGIPHINGEDQIDPELFRKEVEKIKPKKLPMVCSNPDQFAHEGKPPKAVVRQGSIAKLYEEMGGQVFYIGKPHDKAYAVALEEFCKHGVADRNAILMIGDTPETDIRGARSFGMPSALVTQTGMMGDRVAKKGLDSSLKELPICDRPNYFIQRFAHGIRSSL